MALTKVSTPAIKDEAITLAKLLHGDSNSNGKFLRANNGADPTFETVNTDLISDTSPQLGGDLDTNNQNIAVTGGNNITMGDNSRLRLGASNDLDIYHDSNNSVIDSNTGNLSILSANNLLIQVTSSNENAIKCLANGAVELYHNGSKKFLTESNGVTVTGRHRIQDSGNVDLAITDTSANAVAAYIGVKTAGYVEYNCYKSGVGTKYPHVFYGYTEEYARIDSAGIKFNGDTATANALDDYEEGTWTPTDASGGGISVSASNNRYTKVGRMVFASGRMQFGSSGNGSTAKITLPFTPTSDAISSAVGSACFEQDYDGSNTVMAAINDTGGVIFRKNGSGNLKNDQVSGKVLRFCVYYMAA